MSGPIILLPAVNTSPADAVAAGFVAAVERLAQPRPQLTLVDLPLRGLADRAGLDALCEECIGTALAAGRRPWLAGVSLGGWLALMLAARSRPGLAGVALIAPWLGTRELHREIAAAGGAADWAARGSAIPGEGAPAAGSLDEERAAWRFLAAPRGLPVWLGYGSADRFAPAQALAATLLPAERVYVAPGGSHDWPCWADIWEHFLRWMPR